MPKLKTKRTLLKRIKITKSGRVMKKQNGNGHLKVKMTASRRMRKNRMEETVTKGYLKTFAKLLAGESKGLLK